MFRQSLSGLLTSRGVDVVGQASTAREAYPLVQQSEPDVVVLDLVMPGVNGTAATREILRMRPRTKVVILTGFEDELTLLEALGAGAAGIVLKDDSFDLLVEALTDVVAGRRFFSPRIRQSLSDAARRMGTGEEGTSLDPLASLSVREREVFDLVVRGYSTKDIAQELCVSLKTVETHRTHINAKLGVHSSADLLRFAVANRLLAIGSVMRTREPTKEL
jgi:DNA-binding NarL/FixJ family response regulator